MGILILNSSRTWEKEFTETGVGATLIYPPEIGYNDKRIVELTHVHADPEYRSKGKASKIIEHVKKYAVRQKLKLFIRVCPYGDGDKLNKKQLKKFYTDRGFTKYSNNPDYFIWNNDVQ